MRSAHLFIPLALALGSCLENEEEITVHPDGSIAVAVSAKGRPSDLEDGFPVPLEAPWTAANEATIEWIGGSRARPDEDATLAVRAQFDSAGALPRFFAPGSDGYGTAYLERSTDVRIERKSGRTVYVFERTYHGRTFERLDALSLVQVALGSELFAKIENEDDLDDRERAEIAHAAVRVLRRIPETLAGDALLAAYTQGDASIAPAAAERIRSDVRSAIERVVTEERLARIVDGLFPPPGQPKSPEGDDDLERMDVEVRETLRGAFARGLEAERIPPADRNALRGQLEWLFTARDHTEDLGDETFRVSVRLPGTIVGGNHDGIDDGAATWKFDGSGLRDRDRVLRVVSVAE